MKTITTLSILILVSCKTAFVSDYSFPARLSEEDCFYRIKLDERSFNELSPIVHSHSESVMVDDQWVSTDVDHISGYAVRSDAYNSFLYLIEDALNPLNGREECGTIHVTRLEYSINQSAISYLSLVTLFIPNFFGMPVKVNEARSSYLFEVTDPQGDIIYRQKHSGTGKAKLGFYYGYINSEEKAGFDASQAAIAAFLEDFQSTYVD